jgi:hypothetical protein
VVSSELSFGSTATRASFVGARHVHSSYRIVVGVSSVCTRVGALPVDPTVTAMHAFWRIT